MAKCIERKYFNLLQKFDALRENGNVLTSGELDEEFLKFVENQEVCRKRWAVVATDVEQLQQKLLEAQTAKHQLEIRIKHMRYQVDAETNRRLLAESERDELMQQIRELKNVLCNENNNSPTSSVDHNVPSPHTPHPAANCTLEEETDSPSLENRDNYSRTSSCDDRPSAPPIHSVKSVRVESGSKITAVTSFEVPASGPIIVHSEIQQNDGDRPMHVSFGRPRASENRRRPSRDFLKRIAEESELSDKCFWVPEIELNSSNNNNIEISDVIQNDESSANSVSTVGFLPSVHFFLSKTFFKPEICQACSRKISFGKLGLRCQQCSLVCHVECKADIVDSCVLRMRDFNGTRTKLVDFAPSSPPYIPPLIFYCVKEIEHRGLKHRGLYRECGSDSKIKQVKNMFLRKSSSLPDLKRVLDINTLCGVITSFLRSLPEPLITYELWYQFVNSAAEEKEDNLLRAVKLLPEANRQTLAFLIVHLKKIADTPEAEMTVSSLAVVLGPLLIGHSTPSPNNVQIAVETRMQQKTLEAFLRADADFWKNVLFEFKRRQISSTPRRRPNKVRHATPRTIAASNKYKRRLNDEEIRGSPKLKR